MVGWVVVVGWSGWWLVVVVVGEEDEGEEEVRGTGVVVMAVIPHPGPILA